MTDPFNAHTDPEDIDTVVEKLHARFDSRATVPLGYRIYNLKQLAYLVHDNREAIHAAVKGDMGGGAFPVDMTDLWPIYNEIDLAIKRLPTWTKDEGRFWDSTFAFKSMQPRVTKQPKGVALIISPWNFPWQLALIPLVGAIAAGCPAVIKPSEHCPRSSALLAELIPKYLDPLGYAAVLGGPEESTHLLKKSWGHIVFTGSTGIGKIVAKAAAETLTSSTLELGGKSPVFISKDANIKIAVTRLFTIKQLLIGQICVAPDYILIEKEVVDEFIQTAKETLDKFFPPSPSPQSILASEMTSHLRNKGDYERQLAFLDQAEKAGGLVYRGETDPATRRMGFNIVKYALDGVDASGGLVEQEIFGPTLPIIPVSNLDVAIKYVNDRPHPLALYVCSSKRSVFEKIKEETISGSITWNDFGFATLARSVPFGGVGDSGWGSYHGYDGYREFTHFKATLEISYLMEPLMALRYPPISKFGRTILKFLLCQPLPGRPKSVEDEQRKVRWRGRIPSFVVALFFAAASVVYKVKGGY